MRRILLSIISLLAIAKLFAQDTTIYSSTIALNSDYSGYENVELQAINSIILSNGFYYSSNGSGELRADADILSTNAPEGFCPYCEPLDSSQNLQGLNYGLPVGSLPGLSGVNSSGAAIYSIPIGVPKGNGSKEPRISINYSSHSGNGVLGQGWSLSAISSIMATGRTNYYDGINAPISDTDSECRLYWNGNRLIATNGTGFAASSYETEVLSNTEITKEGSGQNSSFTIKSANGITYEYGKSSNSRLHLSSTMEWKWLLEKEYDRNGNTIKYTYINDADKKQIILSKIEYGGLSSNPVNEVNFHYSTRPNIYYANILNHLVVNDKILDSITIKSNDAVIGAYSFEYDFNYNEALLEEIVQYDKDGYYYNSTKIRWDKPILDIAATSTSQTIQSGDSYIYRTGEFTGDGISDLLAIQFDYLQDNLNYYLYKGTSAGLPQNYDETGTFPGSYTRQIWDFLLSGVENECGLTINNNYSNPDIKNILTGDFDGDGIDEILIKTVDWGVLGSHLPEELPKTLSISFIQSFIQDSICYYKMKIMRPPSLAINYGIGKMLNFDVTPTSNERFQAFRLDEGFPYFLNKSTLPDLAGKHYNNFIDNNKIYYFNPSTNEVENHCSFEGSNMYWGEFNGDKISDYIKITSSGFEVRTYNPVSKTFSTITTRSDSIIGVIDLNDDDLLGWIALSDSLYESGNYIGRELFIDHISGYGPKISLGFYDHFIASNLKVISANIDNRDGQELLLFNDDNLVRRFYNFTPSYANGSISYIFSVNNNEIEYTGELYPGDFNGDGITDLIAPTDDSLLNFVVQAEHGLVVTEITNGLGNKTKYNYNSLSEENIYTKGNGAKYPLIDLEPTWQVVSSIIRDNGVANRDSVTYRYESAKYHAGGKGFLGFLKTIQSSTLQNTKTTKTLKLDTTFFHAYPSNILNRIENSDISEIDYYTSIDQVEDKKFKILTDSIITTDHINNIIETKQLTYNSSGQLLEKETQIGSNKIVNSYTYSSAGWHHPYLFETTTKRISRSDSIVIDSARVVYDSYGNIISIKSKCGTDKELITRMSNYNSYGGPEIITKEGKWGINLTKDSITTKFIYSNDGRFKNVVKNPLNNTTYLLRNDTTGLLNGKSTVNDFTVNYKYGPFFAKNRQILPDSNQVASKLFWAENHPDAPSGSLYYSWQEASGRNEVVTFYDNIGRVLRTINKGFSGQKIYKDIEYDSIGRISKRSLPYETGNTIFWDSIVYDNIGRISKNITADNTITEYDYSALWKKTTVSRGSISRSSEVTLNELGEVTQRKDSEGNIVYYSYYPDGLLKETHTSVNPTEKVEIEYDAHGNKTLIDDPDAGITKSTYDSFGQLLMQINAKGDTVSFEYDKLGRITKTTDERGDINYVYVTDTTSSAFGKIDSIYCLEMEISESYNYDNTYGRLISTTQRTPDRTFTNTYSHDSYGRLSTRTYPSQFQVDYSYNEYGFLDEITTDNLEIWSCNEINVFGQITSYSQDDLNSFIEFDQFGLLEEIFTNCDRYNPVDTVFFLKYGFDDAGNLSFREDARTKQKETFDYDNLGRLTKIEYYNAGVYDIHQDFRISYSDDGNITSKEDVGSIIYYGDGSAGPHALTEIENAASGYRPPPQFIDYNHFNKVETIQDTIDQDTTSTINIEYGLKNQRIKSTFLKNNNIERVKYYFGDYEEDSTGSSIKKYHYINSPSGLVGIFVDQGTSDTLYHVLTDHLGSISAVINAETDSLDDVQFFSYNAWGIPRDPDDWAADFTGALFADRGFTGHEHLSAFDLINMNGRVYDPVLGRFLSPDPFVQFSGAVNGYNRYSYCLNNPLVYTDPSGYFAAPRAREKPKTMSFWDPWGSNINYNQFEDFFAEGRWRYNGGGYYENWYSGEQRGVNDANTAAIAQEMGNVLFKQVNSLSEAHAIVGAVSREVLGRDCLGNQHVLITDNITGKMTVEKVPFWRITGSYYNPDYFLSGVKAYGDIEFVLSLIKDNTSFSSLFPVAWSWELNGGSEAGFAANVSLVGGIIGFRGNDKGIYRSFGSGGAGAGGINVSGQIILTKYYYFGNVNNFTLNNTFRGKSLDFEMSAGEGILGGGILSFMLNQDPQAKGEFMIGVGIYAGIGGGTFLSGSGTINTTDF